MIHPSREREGDWIAGVARTKVTSLQSHGGSQLGTTVESTAGRWIRVGEVRDIQSRIGEVSDIQSRIGEVREMEQ